jgi:uncharacterized protein (TIGR02452 family)
MYNFTPEGSLKRIQVWKETCNKYANKVVPPSKKKSFVPPPEEIMTLRRSPSASIRVVNRDCIDVAQEYAMKGHKVMLLNMADWGRAGGLVEGGVATQEEECFRRSDYHRHLLQSFYPLNKYEYIVSYNVEYYRGSDATEFAELETPFNIDMIASPALAGPDTNSDCTEFTNPVDIDIMRNKIRQLIWAAAMNNNDVLVLSAWGCGAFHCPTKHMAQLFKEVIYEMHGAVPIIIFAIFPAHPSVEGTERDAFKVFSEIIGNIPPDVSSQPTATYA